MWVMPEPPPLPQPGGDGPGPPTVWPLLPSGRQETTRVCLHVTGSPPLSVKPEELPLVFSVRRMGVLLVGNSLDLCLKVSVLVSSLKDVLQPEHQGCAHFHGFEDVPPFSSGPFPSVTSLNGTLVYGNSAYLRLRLMLPPAASRPLLLPGGPGRAAPAH